MDNPEMGEIINAFMIRGKEILSDATPIAYEQGVELAKDLLTDDLISQDFPENADFLAFYFFEYKGANTDSWLRDVWIPKAKTSLLLWETLERIETRYHREGLRLPPPLAEWRADVNEEKQMKPPGKRGPRVINSHRNICINVIIDILVPLGMRPTRNDVTEKRESACDAIKEALEARKEFISFDGIKSIYKNGPDLKNTLPLLYHVIKSICLVRLTSEEDDSLADSILYSNKLFLAVDQHGLGPSSLR